MWNRGRIRDLLASTVASLGLLLVLVGVPVALIAAVGWPLPRSLPSSDAVIAALRYGTIPPQTMLHGLAVVLWVIWALGALAIGLELVAVVRGTVARTLPGTGALQQMAARLVATVMLVSSMATRASAAPLPTALPQPVPAAVALDPGPATDTAATQTRARPPQRAEPAIWTVEPRDSLWTIAERTLGNGRRWREIADLNVGRTQPDGASLRRGDTLIRPGWRLELPSDADLPERSTRITVEPGDDLWHLAEEHLGGGDHWRALFGANKGRRQADGRRLSDPDLIRPGWVLHLPDRHRQSDGEGPRNRHDRPDREREVPKYAQPEQGEREDREPTDGRRRATERQPRGHRDGAHRARQATGERADNDALPPPMTPRTLPPGPASPTRADAGPDAGSESHAPKNIRPTAADRAGATDLTRAAPTSAAAGRRRPPEAINGMAWPVAGALIAAGLVSMLARRRRHWMRVHGGSRPIDPVDPETAELERWLRSMADHDLERRLDRALCVLTDHFDEHGVSPTIAAVEIGEQVAFRLADPATAAPPGIISSAGGRRWTLSDELEVAAPRSDRRYVPALLSCGVLPSGSLLLVNPLAVEVLGVVGEDHDLAEAATSWTTELASSAAKGVEIVVVGGHHQLVERLARVTVAPSVKGAVERVHRVLDEGDAASEQVSHVVVVHAPPVTRDAAAELRRAVDHPRAALVLIGGHADTHLHLVGDRVRLAPDDEWLDAPTWLTPDDWDRFGEVLRRSSGGPVPVPPPPPLREVSIAHVEIDAPSDADEADPVVGLLGPLTLNGRASDLDADAAELLTYLAVEQTGADPVTLKQMLWPTRSGDDRAASAAAAIADALTRSEESGAGPVIETDDGRLELTDSISTDLAVFRQLARGIDRLPLADQARRLRAALDLVRGAPFATGARWAQANGDALRVTALIVDVAHRLATQALAASDLDLAMFAVDRGLRAAPMSELLHRDGLRIADAAGDVTALDARMGALRDLVEADGAWVTHETEALYLHLRGDAGADGSRRDAS